MPPAAFSAPRAGDWEAALGAFLAACEGRPYAWGEHDCALFAAGAVQAMTGADPAAAFRGRYRSKRGAAKALRELGAGTLEATIDGLFETITPAFAQRGDLVLHEGAVGVSAGRFALFVGDALQGAEGGADVAVAGLVRVPRAAWEKAWRVE